MKRRGVREVGLPRPEKEMQCSDPRPHTSHEHEIVERVSQNTAQPDVKKKYVCFGIKPTPRSKSGAPPPTTDPR